MNLNTTTNIDMELLTKKQCENLYKKYDTPAHVIRHCIAVGDTGARIAQELNAKGLNLDVELIRVSGYVHDVMRTREHHGEMAAEMLERIGHTKEADVVRDHMHYDFGDGCNPTETDIMCLADRLVKEDEYVGIDKRIDYLINKPGRSAERTNRLLLKKEETVRFMSALESRLGQSIDSIFFGSDIISRKLGAILNRVEKPARYIGSELGMCEKDPDGRLRFAFAFPDLYEIGMSYMGLQILYNLINKHEEFYCERVFEPAPDMARLMRSEKLPLFTLETKTAVHSMDVLGFTLQYEMSFTNIADILDLAGIPLMSKDRTENFPLVIAGGPCAYQPEPLADMIDVFLIGDGEALLPAFLKRVADAKAAGIDKVSFLKDICAMTGIYVPSFYEPVYNDDGTLSRYRRLFDGAPEKTERAVLDSIEDVDFLTELMIPYIETVHDRAVVEMFRGCTRGCRFCQAGMIYRPVRERKPETIKKLAGDQLKSTRYNELSLLSLSTSDYSRFEELTTTLMKDCAAENVALSLPSLRLDTFSFNVLNEIQKYRKSGLTFAPEAGTQRLRDVINKGITEKDIFSAVRQAIELGWNRIKFYFMIGLPTEKYEDLDGIASIASRCMEIFRASGRGGRFNINVSVSNFVPKAHTPFQWAPQDSAEVFRAKHDYLKSKLRIRGVTFSYHDDFMSVLEALIARGDRRLGNLIVTAYKNGCLLDSWAEYFDRAKWERSIEKCGIDVPFYASRERTADEFLPWDIIDSSVKTEYLKAEYDKALHETTTHDCRFGCTGCGINRRTKCALGGIYE